jgi:hydrogenase maturation factor
MGRVVLLYGIPDQRQKIVDDEIIGQNVEVWTYNKNSRYDFVFAQENYIGPYILVHSNMPGETRDRKWENYLKNNRDRIR